MALQDYQVEAIKKNADKCARLAAEKAGNEALEEEANEAAAEAAAAARERVFDEADFNEFYKEQYLDAYSEAYKEFIQWHHLDLGEENYEAIIAEMDDSSFETLQEAEDLRVRKEADMAQEPSLFGGLVGRPNFYSR